MEFTISLKKNYEFRRLYSKGNCARNPVLVVYCRRNGRALSRLGITVGGKLGCAVVRNRVRRRIREIYRLNEVYLKRGFDIVVVARAISVQADYKELERCFLKAAGKLGLIILTTWEGIKD